MSASGNMRIFTFSTIIHGILLILMVVFCSDGCSHHTPKETIIPMEFIVVTEENTADFLAEEPNDVVEETPTPEPDPLPPPPDPLPEPPLPEPDPLPPPPTPDPPIAPPEKVKERKPKEPVKKPEEKTKAQKPTPKKAAYKKPSEIKKGKRVGPVTTGKKNPKKAATEKALSADEIAKMLGAGAVSGSRNQVPKNEASRCLGVIKRVFQEACSQYGLETSPTGIDPELLITFGSGGRVNAVRIGRSSGNRAYDQQVLQACKQVRRIDGLSQTFLKTYSTVTLRLSVE